MANTAPANRAIYLLSGPQEVTNPELLTKYDSAAKISPTGVEDFLFEAALHDQGESCTRSSLPYDVYVYSSDLLYPTNCVVGTNPGNYSIFPEFAATHRLNASIDWPSKNSRPAPIDCTILTCASGTGVNVLKGGVCSVDWPEMMPGQMDSQVREPGPLRRKIGTESTFVDIDVSGVHKKNPCVERESRQLVACESLEHAAPQNPIHIGRGAHDFAFIDGSLIYTQAGRIWELKSRLKAEPQACIPIEKRQCHPPQRHMQFTIKFPEHDEGVDIIDISEGSMDYYPRYEEDGTVFFQNKGTKIRFPLPGVRRPVVLSDGETDDAGRLLNGFLANPYHRVFEGLYSTSEHPEPSSPWWSYLYVHGGYLASFYEVQVGYVGIRYFPLSWLDNDLLPYVGIDIGGKWGVGNIDSSEPVEDYSMWVLGIDAGLRSHLLSFRKGAVSFLDEIGLRLFWNPEEGFEETYTVIPYLGLIDFMYIFSLELIYRIDGEYGHHIGLGMGLDIMNLGRLFRDEVKKPPPRPREDRPNPVEEAEDRFSW